MSNIWRTFQEPIGNLVRGHELYQVERNLSKGLIGYALVMIFACEFFWKDWPIILQIWIVFSIAISGIRLFFSLRSLAEPVQARNKLVLWRILTTDTLLSFAISLAPAWVAFHAVNLAGLYMMVIIVSLMWGGVLVYISLFPVAVGFISGQVMAWLIVMSLVGWNSSHVGIIVFLLVVVLVALVIGRQLYQWLEDGLHHKLQLERQALELQQQTEIIQLLLKEHETESSDWLWQTDTALRLRSVSTRFASAFCRLESELESMVFLDVLSAGDIAANVETCQTFLEYVNAGRSFRDLIIPGTVGTEQRWWSVSGRPTLNAIGQIDGFRGVMADVTEEQRARAEVLHLAHYDSLTDLPNRASFLQRLNARLQTLGDSQLAVIYLDLDGFKLVNDRYGHSVGDKLLIAVAERLQSSMSNLDLVARLSGDEFVIKTRIANHDELETLCKRLLKVLSQPFLIDDMDVQVGASLGIAFAPSDGTTADLLLKNADAALYRAKRDGRGTYRFFAKALDQKIQDRADLLDDLRNALPKNELLLHYQPFVNAGTSVITGYEALIRWQHPRRGLIPPISFVPLAEESNLIVPIGAWVIHTACAEAVNWSDDTRVSVNISPVQFQDRALPERILEALMTTGLPAHRLEIELTESIFLSDVDQALALLRRIRALGVKIALDDFGTGYSSLSYLQSFPFDKIKIDRSFVRDLSTRPASQVIVQAVSDIARGLGMTITAEGVETSEHAVMLQSAGCHELQGYLYGRPEQYTIHSNSVQRRTEAAEARSASVSESA